MENMTNENKVLFYKRKANSFFDRAKTLESALEGDKINSIDEHELMVRLNFLGKVQEGFNLCHNSLEEFDFNEIGSQLRESFDELIISIEVRIRSEISKRNKCMPSSSTFRHDSTLEQQSIVVVNGRSRLPELQLPTFSGGYTEWADFISMFNTIVDKNSDITKIEKLQHLRSCLMGSALETIRSLEVSETNYTVALDLLDNRFNNKRLIFQAHIAEILGQQKVDGSVGKLRELSDKLNGHMRALKSIGTETQIADCIIVHSVFQHLDRSTQAKWEESTNLNEIPTWKQLSSFLVKRCQTMENVMQTMSIHAHSSQVGKNCQFANTSKKSFVASNIHIPDCIFCNSASHTIYNCSRFSNLSQSLRLKEIKRLGVCFNCLKKGHRSSSCNSSKCRTCGGKHHTLLHINNTQASVPTSTVPISQHSAYSAQSPNTSTSPPQVSLTAQILSPDIVLLATAIILVKSRSGALVPCRALLDSGSQLNIITSRLAQRLQLKQTKNSTFVSGIGDSIFKTAGTSVQINMQSQNSEYNTHITALVAPNITEDQPTFSFDVSKWNMPSNIRLADPSFNKTQHIDLLIGASLFYEILCVGQIKLMSGSLLQKTRFGWVVTGGGYLPRTSSILTASIVSDTGLNVDSNLDELVRQFWETENPHISSDKATKEQLNCEEHFKESFSRLPTGEYSVRLPLKLDTTLLGESYQQAYRRFINLERKLERLPELKEKYSDFIHEYINLKHMSPVDATSRNLCKYFLPHHCVIREDKTTTKLRVVFDGSAQTSSGYSLNDIMMAGPTIQPKLFTTLLNFRTFPVALTGDICKMYRCVRVSSPDNYLQCILWRDNPQDEINVFKLNTVTYGTKPASFLAIRAMQQLAVDEQSSYPIGSQVLLRDFYVDDLLTGGNFVQDVIEIMQQTADILSKGIFKIKKWCSNNPTVLEQVPTEDKETLVKFNDGSNINKTLGLAWNPQSDKLLFSFSPSKLSMKPSKRAILSTIARFYDPLGLIGPVITKAKIFLQQLWKEQLDWDESLPMELNSEWLKLIGQFGSMHQISYPRLTLLTNSVVEVHGFCDASIKAYGACIYLVSRNNIEAHSHLLCSKSRVAPVKTITIPKLELCGAALLAQLMHEIGQMPIFTNFKYYCWCDSTVTLEWIKRQSSNFVIFVANRISLIQELTSGMEWRYVPTYLNPADILSRGSLPAELIQSQLWEHGPPFLRLSKDKWPAAPLSTGQLPELRKKVLLSASPYVDIVEKCKFVNSFSKMQRIFGYVYKFLHRTNSNGLTVSDLHHGTEILLRLIQRAHLRPDIESLKLNKQVATSSCISSLMPFLDSTGLLRVGGRLKNSALDFEARHPIILPKRHPITLALIMHYHLKNLHAGPQTLLAVIRLSYWPLGGRKTVANVVNKCVICFRARPRMVEHIMGDLPKERVSGLRAFMVTGVDYCGPFFYKSEVRNRPPVKCYISLFICFASKAVHLELVKDLSTPAFLGALQRFISIRGRPNCIWSDNATNFVGARNELAELKQLFLSQNHQQAIHQFCLTDHIDWRFIPPRSPHFGGLWEAAVKAAKHHFYRTLGSSLLGFDELRTLVCNIAAIINSRPLFSLSENPNDIDVLTPSHFLIGAPITSFVEPDLTKLNFNRIDRWQRVSYLQQIFWSRWHSEYLSMLQERTKWRTPKPELHVNDIVLVKDENLPPLKWPLARVVELITGSDNVARVAVLKTSGRIIRRVINKLCLLPVRESVESPSLPTEGSMLRPAPNTI